MIEALKLSRVFPGGTGSQDIAAASDVSFSIGKGAIVGMLGPNGAGKSTTIRMLVTSLLPSSGTARIADFDILKNAREVRERLGYLPDQPPLYNEMRVREYLSFVARVKGVHSRELRTAVDRVLDQCDLVTVAGRLCGNLSRGFRQRVGLAQALVHRPPVIILDEPTSGLDPLQIVEMRKLIGSLRGEHTVLISTHILQEVTQLCSHVVMLARGKVVLSGSLDEVTREKSIETRFIEALDHVG
ncbi:MAG: ABC transporter ATP-binding protein [Deltaproteobacteria bacterium]|nr:ABC transporter ATP-binding protein [Deltaproteobacteria bacterium]